MYVEKHIPCWKTTNRDVSTGDVSFKRISSAVCT